MHKYLLKSFYKKTNKKKYNLLIWQYNVYYTNIITIKDMIISKKIKGKKRLSKYIENTTALAKVAQVSNLVNFIEGYI